MTEALKSQPELDNEDTSKPELESSPRDLLEQGLADEIDRVTRDLGERTLPLNKAPYTMSPYYDFPPEETSDGFKRRHLQSKSLSFTPDVRGVRYWISTKDTSRDTSLQTGTGPKGSFEVSTEITEQDSFYRIGLSYVAPDPGQETPAQIAFFNTRLMASNEIHLPHDSPHCREVLDALLGDIQAAKEAVNEFETTEGLAVVSKDSNKDVETGTESL
jgi:hypothetical protein